ncbi:MAG TPA: class I SAM-dependent methyltransferase [Pyrinomonadaceae bacterium]|nr:class I SAM-dependent methyltransferase [Pyrinomonadaceae bacterium]
MLRSLFRVVVAAVVLAAVCIAWLILFLLFAPFLLIASLIRGSDPRHPREQKPIASNTPSTIPLIFDRRTDVSKLYGCNTRNVRYRWSLFETRLEHLQREFKTPKALDFGAGSLRDTYELASRGFKVTAFDLNDTVLQRYYESYDWTTAGNRATIMSGSLADLTRSDPVQLIIAFDVIEHLEDPASYVKTFNKILSDDGYLLTIVPNRRSLFERYFKRTLAQQKKRGAVLEPGVPHVQFKTPEEWDQFFEANGFRIVDRDMTIGHFVNDWWNGLLAVPLRSYVYPVLEVIAYRGKFNWNVGRIEAMLCPPWLMERVNVLDQWLKSWSKCCFGWNLIVAQPKKSVGRD